GTTCTAQPRPLSPTSGPTRPHLTANCLPLPRSMSGTWSILMTVFSDISQTPFQTNRNALLRLASKFHRQLLYGYTQVGRLTRFDAFATALVDTRCVRAGVSGELGPYRKSWVLTSGAQPVTGSTAPHPQSHSARNESPGYSRPCRLPTAAE